jgi:hypothetical protein
MYSKFCNKMIDIASQRRMPNLAWIRKGYHGYYVCTTDNAISAQANTKILQVL